MSRFLPLLAALAILALATALLFGVYAWKGDRCQAKGGHLVNVYKGTICVSADGRVLE